MNYFLKGLRENMRNFLLLMVWFGFGALAVVDVMATAVGGSPFKLRFFYGFIIGSVIIVVLMIVYKAVTEKQARDHQQDMEVQAALFEPGLIKKIEKLAEDPEFNTFCYQCIYFVPDVLHCSRNMKDERLKEIRINNRKYCLYWTTAEAPGPG